MRHTIEESQITYEENPQNEPAPPLEKPYHIRLPEFLIDEPVGLGDVIKRATSVVGFRPCGGCERRAALLNRWLVFSRGNNR